MAVLKNKRSMSKYEYEHTFDIAYKHIVESMNSTPNRFKRWINAPIHKMLNEIYSTIMELRTSYFPNDIRSQMRLDLINSAISKTLSLQPYFCAYWNIREFNDKRKAYW